MCFWAGFVRSTGQIKPLPEATLLPTTSNEHERLYDSKKSWPKKVECLVWQAWKLILIYLCTSIFILIESCILYIYMFQFCVYIHVISYILWLHLYLYMHIIYANIYDSCFLHSWPSLSCSKLVCQWGARESAAESCNLSSTASAPAVASRLWHLGLSVPWLSHGNSILNIYQHRLRRLRTCKCQWYKVNPHFSIKPDMLISFRSFSASIHPQDQPDY